MADMLVKLYTLPDVTPQGATLGEQAIHIRAAHPTEAHIVAAWVREHFSEGWASAAAVSATRQPSSCYLAVEIDPHYVPKEAYDRPAQRLLGFACYDSDVKGMFGPTGVRDGQPRQRRLVARDGEAPHAP